MTTITMPRRLIRPVAGRPILRSALLAFIITLIAGLVGLVGGSLAMGAATSGQVLPGVQVGGVAISGLERSAAASLLEARLPSLSSGAATVVVDDTSEVVPYADMGRGYEMDEMLDAAMAVGRTGNHVADGVFRLRSLVHPTSLPVIVHPYDPPALERIAAGLAERFATPAVDAQVTRDGMRFLVSPSEAGRQVEPDVLRDSLAAAVTNTDPADVRIQLEATVLEPAVTTAQATALADAATATAADLELTIPDADTTGEPLAIAGETIASWISFGAGEDGTYQVILDRSAAAAAVEGLVESVNQVAVNARIQVAGTGLGGVIAGQQGRELDVNATTEALLASLEARQGGTSVPSLALAVNITEPALSTAAAQAALPQMQMISSWTTSYVPGDGNGFGANINIPAIDIDGHNLAPGEWFSFWGKIGDLTLERGYTLGGVIIGGRSVANGAIGGGICSTSTTLFNAALRAGLEMGDRLNHYYYIDRYPNGLDATVYKSDSFVQDMTFRNDTPHPMVIRGYGGSGSVRFELWSVPTGRTVALSDPVVSNQRAARETTQVDTSLRPGTSKRVEYPHDGHDVSVSRTVYAADGSVLHQNTYFSSYRPVNGITLVGPSPKREADPPAEDEEDATAAAGEDSSAP